MSLDRIRGIDPTLTRASPVRPAAISGAATRTGGVAAEVRPLDTAAVLRVLIEEVRSAATERLGFAPVPEREPFPVVDRDRAANVLLKIMTSIAGDARFQPAPDEDPAALLLSVVRTGTERALAELERLPLAATAPRALVEATRDAVSAVLPAPVRQRAQVMQGVQHALLAELASRRADAGATTAASRLAVRYDATSSAARPTLEAAFSALLESATPGGVASRPAPAALWESLEAPVRAALGNSPEVDRALAALRERVLPAAAPALSSGARGPSTDPGQLLDRIATRLATALARPVATPPVAPEDPHALAAVIVETLRDAVTPPPGAPPRPETLPRALEALRAVLEEVAVARPAPTTATGTAATVAPPAPASASAVEDARAALLRLLGGPEIAAAAQREPATLSRWFTDLALALARGLELPYRPDLAPPRRRLGLRRAAPGNGDADPERVAAIETSAREARSDEKEEPPEGGARR